MTGRVVAIGTRSGGCAFRADDGNGNPVIVVDAGDDKLAPIAERAETEVGGGHLAISAEAAAEATGIARRVQSGG